MLVSELNEYNVYFRSIMIGQGWMERSLWKNNAQDSKLAEGSDVFLILSQWDDPLEIYIAQAVSSLGQ